MKKKFDLLKSAKYIVLLVFAVLTVLSLIFMGTVRTNYNISDYLDESTDTKISLGIMEEEFGLISNVSVMVDDVTPDEAEKIKNDLKAIENVIFVNFNSQNTDYYKDNSALFVVLVNGNEYSDTAKTALDDIVEFMNEDYGERVNFGGTVMEKKLLREAIQSEIVLILGISVGLVAVLMLITAASWIEPLVLLAASGIAVLLNMGSNVIFGEISYITKAVAAILQLALSIDYSIVLLHNYRAIKAEESDNDRAMLRAIKSVFAPVSASALTTIAGLLALLFMSFRIGFDIGSVLMKSIVVSAITALTLLPALLLLLDKLMAKTAKKPLDIKGKFFCDVSLKACKIIVPIAVVIIGICCLLRTYNTYNFVDSCNKNENISDKFGDSGTLIVLYEKAEDTDEKERLLAELLASYKTKNGAPVLKSSVAYSSTVGQIFDVEKASRDLGLSEKDAELLFTVYYFTQDESKIKLDVRGFIDFAMDLIENDSDAEGFVSEETMKTLELLLDLDVMLGKEYTATELGEAIASIEMLEGMTLEQSAINQMYGLYFFDEVEIKTVNFGIMLDFLINSGMIDQELSDQLQTLFDANELISGLDFKLTHPDTKIGLGDIPSLLEQYHIELPDVLEGVDEVTYLWNTILGYKYTAKVPFAQLFTDLVTNPTCRSYFPEEIITALDTVGTDYRYIYETKAAFDITFAKGYDHKSFMPALLDLVEQATGNRPDITLDETMDQQMQQLYIMYYVENGRIPDGKIGCIDFLQFVLDTSKTNAVIAERLPEGSSEKLENLIVDAGSIRDFLGDKELYDYKEIAERINDFASSIKSMDVSVSLSEAAMMGVYVKYATATEAYELQPLSATTLLEFVLDAADNNPLLSGRIDDDMRATIRESQENIASAEKLLVADNYSRMLLTVNLPPESAESSRFVEYLTAKVDEIFGEKAYVAGEIATTYDLINAFDEDNKLISIFTVISIFAIIMVVFKSISLPVLLVAVIQGAVWIAMSMSLVSGGSMFFMSYIMAMCILMGATIDYGILLSTNYVNYRATLDKREAINKALDAAMPTIFNSGLILMICGFVVGLVASQTSISSVGFLLFRGTLVSVIMITLVLPSLLYLLDKIVLKLTVKRSISEIIKSFKK